MADEQVLPWTGERLVPEYMGGTAIEHLHRYAFAREFVNGKIVLDIASGEGYGSKMLSRYAKAVIGVDISEQAVSHANAKYGDAVDFRLGSCTAIPVADTSVDLVNSFETLEHIIDHEVFFEEIKRVLKPSGILIISTPDKLHYTIGQRFANEYHVRELSKLDFVSLVAKSFKNIRLFEQAMVSGSVIASCEEAVPSDIRHYLGDYHRLTYTDGLMNAPYLIIVASDADLIVKTKTSLFKGWDIPTEEEKLLAESRQALLSERSVAEQRIAVSRAQHVTQVEEILAAHRMADSAIEIELARLRKEIQMVATLQNELDMLRHERERMIFAHREEVAQLKGQIAEISMPQIKPLTDTATIVANAPAATADIQAVSSKGRRKKRVTPPPAAQ
jgi:SAM-dependent methyltransferase